MSGGNKETKVLVGALLITAVILGGVYWIVKSRFGGDFRALMGNQPTPTSGNASSGNAGGGNGDGQTAQQLQGKVSGGDTLLLKSQSDVSRQEQQAIGAFAEGDYSRARKLFAQVLQANANNPEARIYYQNANLLANPNAEVYTIAVVVPARVPGDRNKAAAILRGVAQAQHEANESNPQINGKGLQVLIADDANSLSEAEKVARRLAASENVVAVLGHYTSETTQAALPVYQEQQVPVISASSTSDNLSEFCAEQGDSCFFFRTVGNNQANVDFFSEQLVSNARRAAILYSFNSDYSQSFQSNFQTLFPQYGGTVTQISANNLSQPGFDAQAAISQAQQQGSEGIVLVPDGGTSAASLRNAIDVLEANQGQLWIAGSSALYNPETLRELQDASMNTLETFVTYAPWHYTTGCQTPGGQAFCDGANQLWGTRFLSWRTAMAYDAARATIAGLRSLSGSGGDIQQLRQTFQQTLSDPSFEIQGATGVVAFDPTNHNRENPPREMVRIALCERLQYGLVFLPLEYNTPADAGLSCS
jgi:branched-chain amino acid transport system substrate-binding protein